jgi:hypothetical protein
MHLFSRFLTALAVIFSLAFSGLAQADNVTIASFSGNANYIYTDDDHRVVTAIRAYYSVYGDGYRFGQTWGNLSTNSPTDFDLDLNRLNWDASWLDFGFGQVALSAIPGVFIDGVYGTHQIGDFIPGYGAGEGIVVFSATPLVAGQFVFGVPAVPEPETYALLLVGLGLVGFIARRRRNLVRR